MAYPTETRVNALNDYVNGQTDEQISAKHGVSVYTINNWKKLLLATGSLDKRKVKRKSGTPYKYKPEKIAELLDKNKTPVDSDSTATKTGSPSQSQGLPFQTKTKRKKSKKQRGGINA